MCYPRGMSRVNCDVVVVGTELCGLVAAALVSHVGGRRVVVVDDGDPQDALPLGDRLAPIAATWVRLASTGPAAQVFEAVGLKQDARRVLGDAQAIGILDDPDTRLLLFVDADKRNKELERVFVNDHAAIAAALAAPSSDARYGYLAEVAHVHEDGFFEKRRHQKRIALLGHAVTMDAPDAAMRAALALPLGVALAQLVPFVQGRGNAAVDGTAGVLALQHAQAGAYTHARGGLGPRAALRDELLRQIVGHGGEYLKERVDSIDGDGKTISALNVTGSNTYVAKVVIDATSRRDLSARLAAGRRTDKLKASEHSVRHADDAVSVRWLVPRAVLPRPLPSMSLVLRAAPARAAVVGVYLGAPLKEGQRGGGVDDSFVAVVASTLCETGAAQVAAQHLEATLDALLPFASAQVRARDVVAGAIARCALPQWFVDGPAEHPYGGRRPQTAFKNLVRAGRDVVPGLGLDGEIVSARAVAHVVERMLGVGQKQAA